MTKRVSFSFEEGDNHQSVDPNLIGYPSPPSSTEEGVESKSENSFLESNFLPAETAAESHQESNTSVSSEVREGSEGESRVEESLNFDAAPFLLSPTQSPSSSPAISPQDGFNFPIVIDEYDAVSPVLAQRRFATTSVSEVQERSGFDGSFPEDRGKDTIA